MYRFNITGEAWCLWYEPDDHGVDKNTQVSLKHWCFHRPGSTNTL